LLEEREGKCALVLDDASCNKGIRVREQAKASQIILKYQPPYSPDLNLIERLWKFMRKKFPQG
jgi:transposase